MSRKTGRLKSRYTEAYLIGQRNARMDDYSQWHTRIDDARRVANGDWGAGNTKPAVANLVDGLVRDAARLANEVKPTYSAPALGEGQDQAMNQRVRQVIGETYFHANHFDIMRPQLVMDAILTGAMVVCAWTDPLKSAYPIFSRVDPKTCFPLLFNGYLVDLLVIETMNVQVANSLFPSAQVLDRVQKDEDSMDTVEVYTFYAADESVRAIGFPSLGGAIKDATVVQRYPGLGFVPVGFFQVPSPDAAIRGLTDQTEASLLAKDTMVKNAVEYSRQMVYSSWESKGIINDTTRPGPDTIYRHDPSMPGETFMRRTQPAVMNPQLFQLIDFLDNEQRGALAYPATREGEVPVSQGSGSFVQATQGKLTSLVREAQRGLTQVQEQVARAGYELDKRLFLSDPDTEKPLLRNVGRKKTYSLSDLKDNRLFVSYGASAGLDRLNTDVRLLQFYSAGAIPAKRMLAELDFVDDPQTWLDERQDEELERVTLQRFAGDPNTSTDFIMQVLQLKKEKGMSFAEAYTAIMNQGVSSTVATAQPGGPGGMLSPAQPGPEEPAAQQEALQRGSTAEQGAPPIPGTFAPPPLQQVFVK